MPAIRILSGVLCLSMMAWAENIGTVSLEDTLNYPGTGFSTEATVAAVAPAANGAAQVELRAEGEWRPLSASDKTKKPPAQVLKWNWPSGAGPVPVATGMRVEIVASAGSELLSLSYGLGSLGNRFGAQRRMPDGRWEFIVRTWDGRSSNIFLRVEPRAIVELLAFGEGATYALRWTKPHGLLITSKHEYETVHGGADAESESPANRRLGWPISNQPGTRILPGRDGWQRWFWRFGQSKQRGVENPRWMSTEVLASQRLQ